MEKIKKILSMCLALILLLTIIPFSAQNLTVNAVTSWNVIPNDNYVYDTMTYKGITTNALFPRSSTMYSGKYDADSTYSCAALPVRFYRNYGISIRIPGAGDPSVLDGSGSFIQVSTPQIGDVLRKPGVHWAIVKSVSGNTITVFEQNYWWNTQGTWYAGKNRTITQSDIDNGTWVLYRCTSFNSSTSGNTNQVTFTHRKSENTTSSSNAEVHCYINKSSGTNVTKIGIRIRKNGSSYTDKMKKIQTPVYGNYNTWTQVPLSYNFTEELSLTLNHLTKYYYQFYTVIDGKEYWSSEESFTTKGSHSYGSWTTTKAATCTSVGSKKRTCSCGAIETSNIAAKGHDWSSSFTVDKKATCTSEGSKSKHCLNCSAKKEVTVIPVELHSFSSFDKLSDATCTEPAKEKWTCGRCNIEFVVNLSATQPALGHTYKTTTTKATLSKNGKVVKKCTVCGKVASTTTIKYAKTFKLSATTYTYNGKVKTPSVVVKDSAGKTLKKNTDYTVTYSKGRKNVGTYKVTIKMKGKYSGTKTLTFKINPAKTSVSKLTAGKKSITVNIAKKSTQVSGYQVQYSTSKKFTNAKTKTISSYKTTKYTLKSLGAKKTYYVRVRTYKTVSGKKYYSGWSSYKYVKTK